MNWNHLIDTARLLAGATGAPVRGRPRQMMLRKAVSAAYYAVFHALCTSNANALVGTLSVTNRLAWLRTYRALDHAPAKNRMEQHRANLTPGIRAFANAFATLQEQRHEADYDPDANFGRSDVITLIDRAESATRALFASNIAERRSLATLVLLRDR